MKVLGLVLAMTISSSVMAAGSIHNSNAILNLIEATSYAVEASGEFLVHENTWIDEVSSLNCKGGISSEEVVEKFVEFTEYGAEDLKKSEVAQAIVDFKSILGERDDFVYCTGYRSVMYYGIDYHIFYVDGYKIAFEIAWEN